MSQYKPGDRVRWDNGLGVLQCMMVDEDTGEVEKCIGVTHEPMPLWVIRFDNGHVRRWCCEHSIRGKLS